MGGELRPWRPSDADRLVEAWNDPSIAAWNPVPPEPTLATATRWIDGVADREANRTSFDWVIDIPAHGGVVGEVGFAGFNPQHDGAFIGYWLLPQGRGNGLATTAVDAATTWAHDTCGLGIIVARCDPKNPASGAVVARVGYRKERSDAQGQELWISRTREA